MNDNESTYSDPAVRQAIVDSAVPVAADWFPVADSARTYLGNELPEPSMTKPVDSAGCYPKGPTPRQLVDLGPRFIPGTEIQVPPIADTVVHVWNAFAGLALELGGYQDVEVCDPYSGRRLWVPIPDDLGDNSFAWYQYALQVAARYNWSREGDGGLIPQPGE